MEALYAAIFETAWGRSAVCWRPEQFPKVCQIYLSHDPSERLPDLSDCVLQTSILLPVAEKIQRYCAGENVHFDVADIDMNDVPPFRWTVYLAAHKIPFGRVWTYGRLAHEVNNPRAARAVGQAMAHNRFAPVVPCHRVIAAGGRLGGFGPGPDAKRLMLRHEGIRLLGEDRVDPAFID